MRSEKQIPRRKEDSTNKVQPIKAQFRDDTYDTQRCCGQVLFETSIRIEQQLPEFVENVELLTFFELAMTSMRMVRRISGLVIGIVSSVFILWWKIPRPTSKQ